MTPETEIDLIGKRGTLRIRAIVDTGSGFICLPVGIAIQLGLELVDQTIIELADGSQHSSLMFSGRVSFLGREQTVRVVLTESEDALLGTSLLDGTKLTIDFDTQRVHIQPKKRLRKER